MVRLTTHKDLKRLILLDFCLSCVQPVCNGGYLNFT